MFSSYGAIHTVDYLCGIRLLMTVPTIFTRMCQDELLPCVTKGISILIKHTLVWCSFTNCTNKKCHNAFVKKRNKNDAIPGKVYICNCAFLIGGYSNSSPLPPVISIAIQMTIQKHGRMLKIQKYKSLWNLYILYSLKSLYVTVKKPLLQSPET